MRLLLTNDAQDALSVVRVAEVRKHGIVALIVSHEEHHVLAETPAVNRIVRLRDGAKAVLEVGDVHLAVDIEDALGGGGIEASE